MLFQGPDARESIDKMSKQAQANIQTLEEQGKIDYYVNAFDIVSMLNRNKKVSMRSVKFITCCQNHLRRPLILMTSMVRVMILDSIRSMLTGR